MKKILVLLSLFILLSAAATYAHDTPTPHTERDAKVKASSALAQATRFEDLKLLDQKRAEHEQKKTELMAKAQAKKDDACKRRLEKLDNRIANADNRKKGLLTHYQKADEHLQKLIDRGDAAGVDVTELKADLVEYNIKVDGLTADFDAFVELVGNTQTLDCEQPKEQFRSLHEQIKAAHQKIVNDRKAIHDYYKATIRPDVVTVIKAIAAIKSTKPANESNEQPKTGSEL